MAPWLVRRARTVVVAMPSFNRARMAGLVEALPFPRVVLVPDLPGVQSLWITARDLGGAVGLDSGGTFCFAAITT